MTSGVANLNLGCGQHQILDNFVIQGSWNDRKSQQAKQLAIKPSGDGQPLITASLTKTNNLSLRSVGTKKSNIFDQLTLPLRWGFRGPSTPLCYKTR